MILVIDQSKKNAINVSDMFFYMGVLAKAVTVSEAFAEISNTYRAIIILSPEDLPDAVDFIKRLHGYSASIPIFAIGAPDNPNSHLFAKIFPTSSYAFEIMSKILEYTLDNDLPQPGDYKLAGLDFSCDLAIPTYFWTPLPLTKTESMIIKYLIRTYPRPTTAEEILRYSYKESNMPEISNIRTHISIINKKFRKLTKRNLVEMSFGRGYRVLTPEVAAALV
jgi:hypothetical protein